MSSLPDSSLPSELMTIVDERILVFVKRRFLADELGAELICLRSVCEPAA